MTGESEGTERARLVPCVNCDEPIPFRPRDVTDGEGLPDGAREIVCDVCGTSIVVARKRRSRSRGARRRRVVPRPPQNPRLAPRQFRRGMTTIALLVALVLLAAFAWSQRESIASGWHSLTDSLRGRQPPDVRYPPDFPTGAAPDRDERPPERRR